MVEDFLCLCNLGGPGSMAALFLGRRVYGGCKKCKWKWQSYFLQTFDRLMIVAPNLRRQCIAVLREHL